MLKVHQGLLFAMAAVALAGCVGDYKVNKPDPLPVPTTSELAGHKEVAVIFVHGISCHEPGYSAPFQYRFAARLGLKRAQDQTRAGAPVTDFYAFADPQAAATEGDPKSDLYVEKRWFVSDPDFFPWVQGDESGAKRRVEKGLAKLAEAGERSPDGVEPFTTFTDVCTDRGAKSAALPRSPMHNAGINVRSFEGSGVRYTFYEVLWSPISERWKVENLGFDFGSGHPDQPRGSGLTTLGDRALINGKIKDEVLNGGIPDAVFYIGQGNRSVKAVIKAALCLSQDDREPPSATADPDTATLPGCEREGAPPARYPHTLFFSESLGSRALLDALAELPMDVAFSDALQKVDRRPMIDSLLHGSFFMFANQLPMIEIGQANYSRPVLDTFEPQDSTVMDNVDAIDRGSPIDLCIVNGGRSATNLYVTDNYTPALRAFRDGAKAPPPRHEDQEPMDVFKSAPERKAAIEGYLEEIANCRRAVWDNHDETPDWAKLQLAYFRYERLANIGPRGLDLQLQLRAIDTLTAVTKAGGSPQDAKAKIAEQRLRVYAFSDANDLLTWEVNDRFKGFFSMVDFTNIQHRVAKPLLPFAGGAGLFVDPLQAHMGYRYSDRTLDVIFCALGEPSRSKRRCDTLGAR